MYNSDDGVIIAISAAKYEPRNFWTGSWRAVWRVSFAAGTNKGADIKVNGQLDLSVHFYEDGNVQLRAGNALEAKVKVTHRVFRRWLFFCEFPCSLDYLGPCFGGA